MLKLPMAYMASACFAVTLCVSGCSVAPVSSEVVDVTKPAKASVVLNLKAGQVLQFAMIREREGDAAKAVRKRYFQTAIPFAESLGDEYLGNLNIKGTLLGKNKPRAIAIYAFPDAEAQAEFQSTPDWEEYQKMRRDGWEELHVFSATLPSDTRMTFDPSKDYTFAAAWTRPGTLPDYQRYLDGIKEDFDQIGARYIAQLNNIDLQSHSDDAVDPSQLTIVEWSNGPNLEGLQDTEAYKSNVAFFQKAISRFDFYWVTHTKPN